MTVKTPNPKSPVRRTCRAMTRGGLSLSHRWLWTVDEFQRACDLGAFGFDVRLELIEGEIIEKRPQDVLHSWAIRAMEEALRSIEDYWIVNLPDGVLEVHRQPAAMADQPLGHHYRSIIRLTPTNTVSPLGQPDAGVAVSALLP